VQGAVGLDAEPGPAGTEAGRGGVGELLLERVERAEGGVDGVGEVARGAAPPAAAGGGEDLPEERVVGVAAGVVADGGLLVGGEFVEVLEDVDHDGLVGEVGAFERGVGLGDVGGVVLAVVDLHGLGVDVGLEGVGAYGRSGRV
jgi:hypothetical protein